MKPFYFYHIPKTGGISIRSAIRKAALKNGVSKNLIYDEMTPASYYPEPKQLSGMQIVCQHIRWGAHIDAGYPDARTFTVLRDPVDRTVSHYYFGFNGWLRGQMIPWRNQVFSREQIEVIKGWKKTPPINDCPEDIRTSFIESSCDGMAWHLTDYYRWPDEDHIQYVCDTLKSMDGFGLLCDMKTTQKVLGEVLGFKVAIGHENKGSKYGEPTQEIRQQIVDGCRFDVDLYNYAKNLFQDRYAG
jgi:hypothetical protein